MADKSFYDIPRRIYAKSTLYHARFWLPGVAIGALFTALAVATGADDWSVPACFTLLAIGAAALWARRQQGIFGTRYTTSDFEFTVWLRPGAAYAYLPPDELDARARTWAEYWAATYSQEIEGYTYERARGALKGLTLEIERDILDTADYYRGPSQAKLALTDIKGHRIICWARKARNWHGVWEYEWGHVLYADLQGWLDWPNDPLAESDALDFREAHNLVTSAGARTLTKE